MKNEIDISLDWLEEINRKNKDKEEIKNDTATVEISK